MILFLMIYTTHLQWIWEWQYLYYSNIITIFLKHSHGIDGPFMEGLPINSMGIFHGYVK